MMKRRFLIPEVVQTSAVDCGPACLNALLAGFGVYLSYGRLREACQASVDGTSIDAIEELANSLTLEAEQIVLPADHIALPQAKALPAIAVVRLPSGLTHFVVVWRRHGDRLQVMDPVTGRRWVRVAEFAKELYVHQTAVSAVAWREWAGSEEFTATLKARLAALGVSSRQAAHLLTGALAAPAWRPMATLDATVRWFQSLARSAAFSSRRRSVGALIAATLESALRSFAGASRLIPREHWSVWPVNEAGADPEVDAEPWEEQLYLRGAVLVRVKGRKAEEINREALPSEVAAAVTETPPRPAAALWGMVKQDGALTPVMVASALLLSALGLVAQILAFRALIPAGLDLSTRGQRFGAMIALELLLSILLAIEIPSVAVLVGMGRRLEVRLRRALLAKLPRIAEQYFHSRLTSDMAERGHSLHHVRALPSLVGQALHLGFQLLLTTAAVIWMDPRLWPLAVLSALAAVACPIAVQPLLGERALRARTHAGALSRFYFDSLLGLIPVRTHVADGLLRREHRNLLGPWVVASLSTRRIAIALDGFQLFLGFSFAALMVVSHISRHPETSALLLLAYWGLNIPQLGRDLGILACQYPLHRNVTVRVLEPLGALEGQPEAPLLTLQPALEASTQGRGVAIRMQEVSVAAAGRNVLHDLTLNIPAGSHVAIVGQSGAGKSSLLGLLLGWRTPSAGTILVDNSPLSAAGLEQLRCETAWVDPTVQIWNRSLIENLRYGSQGATQMSVGDAVEEVGLTAALERLPAGLQTDLGDSGGLLSGGEGERVRVGRAFLRSKVRLAILDEPFRGLDSTSRREMLRSARRIWAGATLLFVSHDVGDTLLFDRVMVIEAGTIVEDGAPADLAAVPTSRYSELLRHEQALKRRLLLGANWRRLEMQNGELSEKTTPQGILPERGAALAGGGPGTRPFRMGTAAMPPDAVGAAQS